MLNYVAAAAMLPVERTAAESAQLNPMQAADMMRYDLLQVLCTNPYLTRVPCAASPWSLKRRTPAARCHSRKRARCVG